MITYAALGAFFMPFLALTLFWLLNSRRVEREHRNGIFSNVFLAGAVLLFVVLGLNELIGLLQ